MQFTITFLNWQHVPVYTNKHTHSFSTSCVVPDSVVGELHSVRMLCLLKVLVGMPADVATTSDVPADQTNPQVLQRAEKRGIRKDSIKNKGELIYRATQTD